MMLTTPLLLSVLPALSGAAAGPGLEPAASPTSTAIQADLFAIKARRVEIGNGEVMEHAVLLVEDGVIVTMGQDLPIERGIPVIELGEDQVVMPGIVNPYSRFGMDGSGYNDARPFVMASAELYPSEAYKTFLEFGMTTVGQYPAGQGVPGQAVALRPKGDTAEEMILEDGVYLKFVMRNSSSAKRNLSDGFKKADEFLKKVEEEREKFEKKNSKKSSSKKKDEKDDKKDEKEDEKKSSSKSSKDKDFVAPEPDERVKPFLDMRDGKLQALFSIDDAASYLHLIDAIGEEKFEWHLRVPLTRDIDVFHVKDQVGKVGCFVLMEPLITLMPGTMRQRNLPAEFDRAGAQLILLPRSDSKAGFQSFLEDVGVMIGAGLDRKAAVQAITHRPAAFLGLEEQLGSLQEGRRANLLVFNGDPFQPGTKLDAVMLDGQFVSGDMDQ
ncbi:Imidazolonepropionase [Planctomycetes bacterium Poly30]|uniref:Imidazolonepropionase n=1 Tax=Saltatorellus ferox TaxID=2528018 RepID=A0A518EYD4_9BACT|nr:Imidazolonepropionase [Planctomycetes bacterium Poly30]